MLGCAQWGPTPSITQWGHKRWEYVTIQTTTILSRSLNLFGFEGLVQSLEAALDDLGGGDGLGQGVAGGLDDHLTAKGSGAQGWWPTVIPMFDGAILELECSSNSLTLLQLVEDSRCLELQ